MFKIFLSFFALIILTGAGCENKSSGGGGSPVVFNTNCEESLFLGKWKSDKVEYDFQSNCVGTYRNANGCVANFIHSKVETLSGSTVVRITSVSASYQACPPVGSYKCKYQITDSLEAITIDCGLGHAVLNKAE